MWLPATLAHIMSLSEIIKSYITAAPDGETREREREAKKGPGSD